MRSSSPRIKRLPKQGNAPGGIVGKRRAAEPQHAPAKNSRRVEFFAVGVGVVPTAAAHPLPAVDFNSDTLRGPCVVEAPAAAAMKAMLRRGRRQIATMQA